jgi:hypothetical protein
MTHITNDTPIWFALGRNHLGIYSSPRIIIATTEDGLYAKAKFFGLNIITSTIDHYSSASDMMDEQEEALWELQEESE